jgi:hypothetical protein
VLFNVIHQVFKELLRLSQNALRQAQLNGVEKKCGPLDEREAADVTVQTHRHITGDFTGPSWRLVRDLAVVLLLAMAFSAQALAGPREQARRIHDRLAGVPPTAAVLDQMEASIAGGNAIAAAYMAMENRAFYDVTLKNWAAPWSNREGDVFVPLNDYIATVIGMVRDDVGFNTLLSADILYVGRDGLAGVPPHSNTSNAHYEELERRGVNLMADLVQRSQSTLTGLPHDATAGIMTSRAAAEAFFIAGTNRAMLRFTLMAHMCRDLEQVADTTRSPDRIRQDVSRSPGGDSRLFLNNCASCHTGMDPLAQAFAYYDWDESARRIVYTPGEVRPKYFLNEDTFPYGYITTDDRWDNYWRAGQNALLGWDPSLPGGGQGAKSMGEELGNSQAFAQCQVEKAFRAVCLRPPTDGADRQQINSMVNSLQASGYRMKQVFAESAVYCQGD